MLAPTLEIFDKTTVRRIKCQKENEEQLSFVVNFQEQGWFGTQAQYNVVGEMSYKGQNFGVKVQGLWNRELILIQNGLKEKVWERAALPNNYKQNYSLSLFAL